jgi:hypothetical protein
MNMESRPPGHVLLEVGQASLDLLHLVFVDEVWTKAGERPDDFGDSSREALIALGNRLDDMLATAERDVSTLRDFFERYDAWVDEQLRSDAVASYLPDGPKETMQRILAAEGDIYAERVVALGDSLVQRLPAERTALRSKVESLRGTGPLVTDISHETACALIAIGTMGSLLLCPETGLACLGAIAGGAALEHYCS